MKIEHTLPKPGDPQAFARTMGRFLDRAAEETARAARRNLAANKSVAFSNLLNSVGWFREGDFTRMVAPSTNYGAAVETGTGPAAGKKRYFPDSRMLEPYVKLRSRISFSAKKGSARRRSQEAEVRDRAQGLARFIHEHGTKPHPYMAPAALAMRPRVQALLAEGAIAGVTAGLGGGA